MDDRTPTESDADADLARRVAELEATVARLTAALEARPVPAGTSLTDLHAFLGQNGSAPPADAPPAHQLSYLDHGPRGMDEPDTTSAEPHDSGADAEDGGDASTDGRVDRRRLLTRAGAVAAGAVFGGAAATVATASPAAAATGSFDTSTATPAVTATSTGTGAAVKATSSGVGDSGVFEGRVSITGAQNAALSVETTKADGVGVFSRGWVGVWGGGRGSGGDTTGVLATGATGFVAVASRIGALLGGDVSQLLLVNKTQTGAPMPPPTTSGLDHVTGEIYLDAGVDLWLCVADGTPGTWRRLAGPSTTGALTVLPSPVRVYDSRPGQPPFVAPQTKLPANTPRTGIALTTNNSGIPTDAAAAIVTVTVANTAGGSPSAPGFLTTYPSGIVTPLTSNLNWTTPGAVIANTTTVALGPNATIAAFANYTTDLIIDAIAYYR